MAKSVLSLDQQSILISWVSEGLSTSEINKRAASFDPPFEVSRYLVNYYRNKNKTMFKDLVKKRHRTAMETGLASKATRISKLKRLAKKLEKDLLSADDKLWIATMYGKKFNASEVDQYRAILDDIAKEMGDRSAKMDITASGPIEVCFVKDDKQ